MQVIYDLLVRSSGHLELREDPQNGIIVAGLRSIKVLAIRIIQPHVTLHVQCKNCLTCDVGSDFSSK